MKIIKHGNPHVKQVWTGKCINCSSVMEATRDELVVCQCPREQYEFGKAGCPVCGYQHVTFYEKTSDDDR